MSVTEKSKEFEALGAWYSEMYGRAAPTSKQWQALLDWPSDAPVTIVNFFKMADQAAYENEGKISGQAAFSRYTAVSMPTLKKVGGKFLMVAPFEASFIGDEEQWDLVAIGQYPNRAAVLALFADEDYKTAYGHRVKACLNQKVMLVKN
jgi:uncharacterized protein (DUF1330 family)